MSVLSVKEQLENWRSSRSATWAIVCKVRDMRRGLPDDKPAPYRGGPSCPHYTLEDLLRYEAELAVCDQRIAELERLL